MIIDPIKFFYSKSTFAPGMPFKSYAEDVAWRPGKELEKCLFYLKDFMQVIDSEDIEVVQALRRHRNDLAHALAEHLPNLRIEHQLELFLAVDRTLFKLSNYRVRTELGADPAFGNVDWETAKGHEYLLFEHVVRQIGALAIPSRGV